MSETYTVIQIAGRPNGQSTPFDGMYLKEFDFEYDNGRGGGTFTHKPEEAMHFKDAAEASQFWSRSPQCKPFREDGKPNRPLTATNVAMILVDAETHKPIFKRRFGIVPRKV